MTNTAATKTKMYIGIADAHGIESFVLKDKASWSPATFLLRANANRQRHACYFEADLTEDEAEMIQQLVNAEKYAMALQLLKSQPAVLVSEEHMHSWTLIPNDKLDPYWSPSY